MRVFHLLHNEHAVEVAHAVDVSELCAHELLIRGHVARLNLQREVVFAARVTALRNLVDALYGLHEVVHEHLRVAFQAHVAQHGDAVVCLLCVHYGVIALNESLSLQTFLAVEGGRSGEIHPHCQLLHRERTVLL